ncbi:hypothetical protein F8S13_26695 [Chloroflexia bacterium SDU3-3]|nr:hypothetical protein F8S13_26695 [Chloroflexia bacterium SDU3-3]
MNPAPVFRIALCLYALVLLAACMPDQQQTATTTTPSSPVAYVTLDIFSGRPNPRWQIDDAETSAILAQLAQLVPASKGFTPINKLGYRGFIVELPDSATGETSTISVYRQSVVQHGGGVAVVYDDPSSAIEQILINSAQQHTEPAVYKAISAP